MELFYDSLDDIVNRHLNGRFEGLRRFGIGCSNLLVVILAWIVDGIAAYYVHFCQTVRNILEHCMTTKAYVVNRLIALAYLVVGCCFETLDAVLHQYTAFREFIVACCFIVRDGALDLWIAATGCLVLILPSRETFFLAPRTVYLMIYCFGVYVPCMLLRPYSAASTAGFDIVVSTLIAAGILLMEWRDIFRSTKARILHCLDMITLLLPTLALFYVVAQYSECDPFKVPVTIQPRSFMPFSQEGTLPSVSFTVPLWLHRPHFAVIAILVIGCSFGIAFHAVCKAAVRLLYCAAMFFRLHWHSARVYLAERWAAFEGLVRARAVLSVFLESVSPRDYNTFILIWNQFGNHSFFFTVVAISTLSLALWWSNRDFSNILSTFITNAIDYDVNFLAIMFACIRYATRTCIWTAHRLVDLHEMLENGSFDGKHWAWVSRAEWIEGCMCTLFVTAAMYAAFYPSRAIWNSNKVPAPCQPNDVFNGNNVVRHVSNRPVSNVSAVNEPSVDHDTDIQRNPGTRRLQHIEMDRGKVTNGDEKTPSRDAEANEEDSIGQELGYKITGGEGEPSADEVGQTINDIWLLSSGKPSPS